jgi:uncharacterized protein YndB with AHSA1/START domain
MSSAAVKQASVEPIRKQVMVDAPQERAFRVFTENITKWWPASYSIGAAPMASVHIEPRKNGRWYEKGQDGSECEWGKVMVFDPPRRLVLAWQINTEWKHDPTVLTEVEVHFTPEGPKRTRVDFEHRNLDRLGADPQAARQQMDGGWAGILQMFAALAKE